MSFHRKRQDDVGTFIIMSGCCAQSRLADLAWPGTTGTARCRSVAAAPARRTSTGRLGRCRLAPAENTIDVPVSAGERLTPPNRHRSVVPSPRRREQGRGVVVAAAAREVGWKVRLAGSSLHLYRYCSIKATVRSCTGHEAAAPARHQQGRRPGEHAAADHSLDLPDFDAVRYTWPFTGLLGFIFILCSRDRQRIGRMSQVHGPARSNWYLLV